MKKTIVVVAILLVSLFLLAEETIFGEHLMNNGSGHWFYNTGDTAYHCGGGYGGGGRLGRGGGYGHGGGHGHGDGNHKLDNGIGYYRFSDDSLKNAGVSMAVIHEIKTLREQHISKRDRLLYTLDQLRAFNRNEWQKSSPDNAAIKSNHEKIAEITKELQLIKSQTHLQIAQLLTAEQRTKLMYNY